MTLPILRAIETRYKGYRFRSRLEARWAVFFDALGISWEYEPEGYDLGDLGWYLPDFWLPSFNAFFEVKGTEPTRDERLRCLRLSDTLQCVVLLSHGVPEVEFGGLRGVISDYWDSGCLLKRGGSMEIFAGEAYRTWDVPTEVHRTFWWYNHQFVSCYESLRDFLQREFPFEEVPENVIREYDRRFVVELDTVWYRNNRGGEHPTYKWGRHCSDVFFSAEDGFLRVVEGREIRGRSVIAPALQRMRSARFEHGESPA